MRRILLSTIVALTVSGCDEETVEWSDAPGIEVCEEVVDGCAALCEDDVAAGKDYCDAELYDICRSHVADEAGLVERVPGLFVQLTNDVVMGRKATCGEAMGYLAAWRYE